MTPASWQIIFFLLGRGRGAGRESNPWLPYSTNHLATLHPAPIPVVRLVDRYLRKLDQELHKCQLELEADNRYTFSRYYLYYRKKVMVALIYIKKN
jgi:hypothetical protein